MGPPKGTLTFQIPADLGHDAVIGIDTQFLLAQDFLKGIKLIPEGLHLFHFSCSVSHGDSMRYGWWFNIEDGQILQVQWNEDLAVFELMHPDELFGQIYPILIEYPEDTVRWSNLTKYIDAEVLDEYNPAPPEPISTAMPLLEENMVLLDLLKLKQPSLQLDSQADKELKYTIIEERKQKKNISGHELTQSALDRSWHFQELFGHDLDLFLGELQVCFVHFVVLGNLCSCTQWTSLLVLALRSESFLKRDQGFCKSLIAVLRSQLAVLPSEYVDDLLSSQIVDTEKLGEVLHNLSEILGSFDVLRASFQELHEFATKRFKVEAFSASISDPKFDEEDFEVYDIGDHDADDEDAPAIVY